MNGKESHCVSNFATFVRKIFPAISIENKNGATRSFDFEITRMISDQIALHSVQFALYIQ